MLASRARKKPAPALSLAATSFHPAQLCCRDLTRQTQRRQPPFFFPCRIRSQSRVFAAFDLVAINSTRSITIANFNLLSPQYLWELTMSLFVPIPHQI